MEKRAGRNTIKITLGSYLANLRTAMRLTLREVEGATGGEVSNAYLSQLEHDKIARPSPNILYSLAEVYGVEYDVLMKKAGYIVGGGTRKASEDPSRVATFAIGENLTLEEETELLDYLAYIRSRSRKRSRT